MKCFFGFALVVLSLSMPAFAAKNSEDMTFTKNVKVGSTQVPAGDYKISWTGTDSNVQVSITQLGKTVVTVPAKLEPRKNPYASLSTANIGGAEVLQAIQFEKLNLVLTSSPSEE